MSTVNIATTYDIDEVTGEPTNHQRAEWAQCALDAYARAKSERPESESDVVDLLTDLIHWCHEGDRNFKAVLATTEMHFKAEVRS